MDSTKVLSMRLRAEQLRLGRFETASSVDSNVIYRQGTFQTEWTRGPNFNTKLTALARNYFPAFGANVVGGAIQYERTCRGNLRGKSEP